ncbi:MAG: tellurite resistance TerB family protein [Marinobacter sp.]
MAWQCDDSILVTESFADMFWKVDPALFVCRRKRPRARWPVAFVVPSAYVASTPREAISRDEEGRSVNRPSAYQRYSQQNSTSSPAAAPMDLTPAPAGSAFMPKENDVAAKEELGLILVRAMIAVARADGRLDAQESQTIFQKIQSLGLDPENQNLLVKEMGHPVDMDAIVNNATTPEIAAEIYAASLLAVEVDSAAEKAYLAMLAARLGLPAQLVVELERQVEVQKTFAQ